MDEERKLINFTKRKESEFEGDRETQVKSKKSRLVIPIDLGTSLFKKKSIDNTSPIPRPLFLTQSYWKKVTPTSENISSSSSSYVIQKVANEESIGNEDFSDFIKKQEERFRRCDYDSVYLNSGRLESFCDPQEYNLKSSVRGVFRNSIPIFGKIKNRFMEAK